MMGQSAAIEREEAEMLLEQPLGIVAVEDPRFVRSLQSGQALELGRRKCLPCIERFNRRRQIGRRQFRRAKLTGGDIHPCQSSATALTRSRREVVILMGPQ